MLVFFRQGEGRAAVRGSSREIVLGSVPGKALHRVRRGQRYPPVSGAAGPGQVGVLQSRG
eukprot:4741805-Alexandrium_andersonii.AAC.1